MLNTNYCRRCTDFVDKDGLKDYLEGYIERLPVDQRCTDERYQMRLSICDQCEKMVNGMCAHCGCFVIVRAAKEKLRCPSPTAKW